MNKFKAAIFDFNGTLFWDTAFHDQAFDIMLRKHGVQLTAEEKRVKIHGKTNPIILRGIFGEQLSDVDVENMGQEKESIYRERCVNDLKFAPGALNLFECLKSNRIPMTIATSSGIDNINFYYEHMQLNRWFDFDCVAYDNGTFKGKPNPDVFLHAAQKLGLNANQTIIFEDSIAGIKAAEAAGAGKIYIVNSYNDNYDSFSHEVITDFGQVNIDLFQQ
jgi:beta-phosphoglucomutase-like phosphatase (HAD superfamily)